MFEAVAGEKGVCSNIHILLTCSIGVTCTYVVHVSWQSPVSTYAMCTFAAYVHPAHMLY